MADNTSSPASSSHSKSAMEVSFVEDVELKGTFIDSTAMRSKAEDFEKRQDCGFFFSNSPRAVLFIVTAKLGLTSDTNHPMLIVADEKRVHLSHVDEMEACLLLGEVQVVSAGWVESAENQFLRGKLVLKAIDRIRASSLQFPEVFSFMLAEHAFEGFCECFNLYNPGKSVIKMPTMDEKEVDADLSMDLEDINTQRFY